MVNIDPDSWHERIPDSCRSCLLSATPCTKQPTEAEHVPPFSERKGGHTHLHVVGQFFKPRIDLSVTQNQATKASWSYKGKYPIQNTPLKTDMEHELWTPCEQGDSVFGNHPFSASAKFRESNLLG